MAECLKVNKALITGFVDNMAMLARGRTLQEANVKIMRLMEEEGRALEWAAQANCKFEIDKFALMGFTCRQILQPFQPNKRRLASRFAITIGNKQIKPMRMTKVLSVILDQTLR